MLAYRYTRRWCMYVSRNQSYCILSQTFSKIIFKTDMRDEVINLQDYSAIIPFDFVKTNVCCMVCLRRFIIQPSITDGGVCVCVGGGGANNLLYYATMVHLCVVKSMYTLCYVTCDLSFNLGWGGGGGGGGHATLVQLCFVK